MFTATIRAVLVPRIVSGSPSTGIRVEVDLLVDSEEPITAPVNQLDASFDVSFERHRVGTATIPQLWPIAAGENERMLLIDVFPDPDNVDAIQSTRQLVTQFGAGQTIDIELTPHQNTSTLPPSTSLTIPRASTKIVNQVVAKMAYLNPFYLTVSGTITLANPFQCEVDVNHIRGSCLYKGNPISSVDARFAEGGMRIPAGGSVSSDITVSLLVAVDVLLSFTEVVTTGQALVTAETQVVVSFGGYEIEFDYTQSDIPLLVQLW